MIAASPAANRARWRDLAPRLASAAVMAPLGLLTIWAGGVIWQVVLTVLASVALFEWASLCGARPNSGLAWIAAASLPLAWASFLVLGMGPGGDLTSAGAAPFVTIAVVALAVSTLRRAVGSGVVYVGLGYAALLVLRPGPGGFGLILFIMLVVWANDIGAYLAGRLVGGPRMAPALSPGKTWAGAAGGLAFGVATGVCVAAGLARWAGGPHPALGLAAGQAAFLAVVAQAGDLMESALKRRFGKKDSGSIIPGHGGLLDRVDGLLAASAAAVLIRLFFHGAEAWQ